MEMVRGALQLGFTQARSKAPPGPPAIPLRPKPADVFWKTYRMVRNDPAFAEMRQAYVTSSGKGKDSQVMAARTRSHNGSGSERARRYAAHGSIGSVASRWSVGSRASILSIGSTGSILSIGSTGSILSIGCTGSALSIASIGSLASVFSVGSAFSIFGFFDIGKLNFPPWRRWTQRES